MKNITFYNCSGLKCQLWEDERFFNLEWNSSTAQENTSLVKPCKTSLANLCSFNWIMKWYAVWRHKVLFQLTHTLSSGILICRYSFSIWLSESLFNMTMSPRVMNSSKRNQIRCHIVYYVSTQNLTYNISLMSNLN